jgi:hypothetical protein
LGFRFEVGVIPIYGNIFFLVIITYIEVVNRWGVGVLVRGWVDTYIWQYFFFGNNYEYVENEFPEMTWKCNSVLL